MSIEFRWLVRDDPHDPTRYPPVLQFRVRNDFPRAFGQWQTVGTVAVPLAQYRKATGAPQ